MKVNENPDFVLELEVNRKEYKLPISLSDNAYEVAKGFVSENGID